MLRRRRVSTSAPTKRTRPVELHDWVLSLPWVVEWPDSLGTEGVRTFAVECEPLGLRQMWLLTGMEHSDIAVIVPPETAREIEDFGWGRQVTPMPSGQILMMASGAVTARPQDVEALVLSAYGSAMS